MPKARPDLSTKLVHLTKGETITQSFQTILTILHERKLRGGTGFIKDAYTCICFTEAPIAQLALSLSDRRAEGFKYRALGVMFDKKWIFDAGGRPVIYQTDDEYDLLPEAIRYLHVRYDASTDFTWERERRLKANVLPFTPDDVTLIVPTRRWADGLIESHAINEFGRAISAGQGRVERFPWHIIALSDLGVDIPDDLD